MNTHAHVCWVADDVLTMADELGIHVGDEEAESFLDRHEKQIRDDMVVRGWESIETLLSMEKKKMPRVTFVKKAQKKNPVAEKGEPYYWWKFRYGGKRYSKTYPRASQLTQSNYLSTAYSIFEELEDADMTDAEAFADLLREKADEIRDLGDEQASNRDAMPESLQDGETGQLLEERNYACDNMADELDNAADTVESNVSDMKEWDDLAEVDGKEDVREHESTLYTEDEWAEHCREETKTVCEYALSEVDQDIN